MGKKKDGEFPLKFPFEDDPEMSTVNREDNANSGKRGAANKTETSSKKDNKKPNAKKDIANKKNETSLKMAEDIIAKRRQVTIPHKAAADVPNQFNSYMSNQEQGYFDFSSNWQHQTPTVHVPPIHNAYEQMLWDSADQHESIATNTYDYETLYSTNQKIKSLEDELDQVKRERNQLMEENRKLKRAATTDVSNIYQVVTPKKITFLRELASAIETDTGYCHGKKTLSTLNLMSPNLDVDELMSLPTSPLSASSIVLPNRDANDSRISLTSSVQSKHQSGLVAASLSSFSPASVPSTDGLVSTPASPVSVQSKHQSGLVATSLSSFSPASVPSTDGLVSTPASPVSVTKKVALLPNHQIYVTPQQMSFIRQHCTTPRALMIILLDTLFSREELAVSSAKGARRAVNKPEGTSDSKALASDVMAAIKEYTLRQFSENGKPCMSDAQMTELINNKCASARRALKRK